MSLKISIITPSYNQGSFVEETILSVLAQNYANFEHIVVDGGSTDDTVEILKRFPHLVWVSEKDKGQADALNKGLKMASGDVVGWINSDDYYEQGVFVSILKYFEDLETMWVVGNLKSTFDLTGEIIPDKSPVVTYENLIKNPDIVRQQPTFFRKSFLETVRGWNEDYFMVMDYDLWIRLAKISSPKMANETWAYFRTHALQKTSHENIIRQCQEIINILKREKVSAIIRSEITLKKRWQWIKGYIKNYLLNKGFINSNFRNRPIRQAKKGD